MTAAPGLYVHVPFCAAKCPYCDFYSLPAETAVLDAYCTAVLAFWEAAAPVWPRRADTLYFGGGTPSLLGAERLTALIDRARELFGLADAEITVELNPGGDRVPGGLEAFLNALHAAGANRLSMGLQSAVPAELAALGRRHTPDDAAFAVQTARAAGFRNISLDLMLGVPGQTPETAEQSIRFCAGLGVEHLSAYLLKIEPGTPFAHGNIRERCPDDDAQADLYLQTVEALTALGYRQYEISNFARPGFESHHNLKYWDCREYLGAGPSAHSLTDGVRWYWPRDLGGFLRDWHSIVLEDGDVPTRLSTACVKHLAKGFPTPESTANAARVGGVLLREYAMLRLRLSAGLHRKEALARYPRGAEELNAMFHRAGPLRSAGLLQPREDSLALTPRGFLLSNSVTLRLLEESIF